MNLDNIQTLLLMSLPTAADVVDGKHTVTSPDCVLIRRKNGSWEACGPYQTSEIEWRRLHKDTKIYVPGSMLGVF